MFEMPAGLILAVEPFFQEPPRTSSKKSSSTASESRPLKVLVVDDERLVADTLTEILERSGFEVAVAYDGWTALEAANRFQPDYLLSDVLMPHMNGVELAIAIQKMFPAIRILLFSGQAGISEILAEGQKRGYEFELVAKPIHPLKLIEHLRRS
jgi:CheY-like chemotaxis protein